MDWEQQINRLEVELSALKEKVSFFNIIYGKFDITLAKVQEMIEDRRYENNEELREVYNRLEETESKLVEKMDALKKEMKELHEEHQTKITDIEKWRWLIVGGALVVGYLIEKVLTGAFN